MPVAALMDKITPPPPRRRCRRYDALIISEFALRLRVIAACHFFLLHGAMLTLYARYVYLTLAASLIFDVFHISDVLLPCRRLFDIIAACHWPVYHII